MYEWSDLRIFLAVVREGSALGAAKVLGLNQSTVNRRVQALEHTLGLTLFDRQTRGHKLTASGEALVASAETVETAANDVQFAAERLRRIVSGVVRVTAPEAFAEQFVIPIAAEFQRSYPGVRVEQVAAESRLDIVHGEADVAFRAGSHPEDPRLIGQRLPDSVWGIYCNDEYGEAHGKPAGIDEIAQHDVLSYVGGAASMEVHRWLLAQADPVRVVGTSNTVPNMCAVLRSGLGIGLLPRFVGDAAPGLSLCFSAPHEMSSELWLLTSAEARASPHVRAFIDFVVPKIQAQKATISGRPPAS